MDAPRTPAPPGADGPRTRGPSSRPRAASYSGHVEPGGPASTRDIAAGGTVVQVRKLSVGPLDNNVYLLRDRPSGEALLIDAAAAPERILAELEGCQLRWVVTTHRHADHWQALADVVGATGAAPVHHPLDAPSIPVPPQRPAADGLALDFGAATVRLLHTPGHTPGSVCVLLGSAHLFTGDTLFPGGPGNTFGDAQAFRQIMVSLRERLFPLPDDTWVYPGHGDDTTIGAERPHLDEWKARGW